MITVYSIGAGVVRPLSHLEVRGYLSCFEFRWLPQPFSPELDLTGCTTWRYESYGYDPSLRIRLRSIYHILRHQTLEAGHIHQLCQCEQLFICVFIVVSLA